MGEGWQLSEGWQILWDYWNLWSYRCPSGHMVLWGEEDGKDYAVVAKNPISTDDSDRLLELGWTVQEGNHPDGRPFWFWHPPENAGPGPVQVHLCPREQAERDKRESANSD